MDVAQPLLQPYRMGDLQLANRIVMAPLTRSRSTDPDLAPTELHARYYSQRASAGLIITEGTWISAQAIGWHNVPGLFTETQIRGWAAITDAVHREGGVIFAQLWHTGALSHPDFFDGVAPLAPSAVNPQLRSPTATGNKPTVVPRAMTKADIHATISDFPTAAANALRAGFDGVQLQAGFSYLISQFLNPATNLRDDEYGGSITNRARLLFDVLDAVAERIDILVIGQTPDYELERPIDHAINRAGQPTGACSRDNQPANNVRHRDHHKHCAHHHRQDMQRRHPTSVAPAAASQGYVAQLRSPSRIRPTP